MKKSICVIISIIIIFSTLTTNIIGSEILDTMPSSVSPESTFAYKRVIIIFNNKSSLACNDYTVDDFADIGCKSITDFSDVIGNKVKAAMENIARHVVEGEALQPYNGIELGEYKQIVCLELNESGKENVIAAVKKLQKRSDVLSVVPDYEISVASVVPNDEHYNNQTNRTQKYIAENIISLADA